LTLSQALFHLAPITRAFAVTAGVLAVCLTAERFAPARDSRGKSNRLLNLGAGLVSNLMTAVSAGSVGALATLAVNAAGGGLFVLPSNGLGLIWGAAIYLLAMDLGEYLFHRAQHAVPILWTLHSLHHSDPDFGATTTVRHFWLDPLLKTLTIWLAVGLVFRISPAIAAIYAAATYYNFWTHSNVRVGYGRFSWTLNSPQYHRMHHSALPEHFDCNYAALLPIFDLLSGAYRRPRPDEYPPTGLDTGDRPATLIQALIWPLRSGPTASRPLPTSS
jgi:sterol desaturase/sphingolipid hydroxylase (fatty acid hydroxylase superfamily)